MKLPAFWIGMVLWGACRLSAVGASEGEAPARQCRITLQEFLHEVVTSNPELVAESCNIGIAQAEVVAARTSPNPALRLVYGRDITHEGQPTIYGAGLTQAIETAGKRRLRTEVAKRELSVAAASLEEYKAALRSSATLAYIEAAHQRNIVNRKSRLLEALKAAPDAKNGTKEEHSKRAEAISDLQEEIALAEEGAAVSQRALSGFVGAEGRYGDALLVPVTSTGRMVEVKGDLSLLVERALKERGELQAARRSVEAAQMKVRLARARRYSDVEVTVAVEQATISVNPIDPSPNFNRAAVALSIPLPLFNSGRGEFEGAAYAARQAELKLLALEHKTRLEVRQALALYRLSQKRAATLENKAKSAEEKRGKKEGDDAVAVEKEITAQQIAHEEALLEQAKAAVVLRRAVNLWD